MARTNIAPFTPPGGYPTLPLGAGAAQLTLTAADNVNGNMTPSTGRELLLVQNSDAAAQTVTVSSVPDGKNRTGDITAYSIPASDFAILGPFPAGGWKQPDGNLYFSGSAATVKFCVIQLPPVS